MWLAVIAVLIATGGPGATLITRPGTAVERGGLADTGLQPPLYGRSRSSVPGGAATPSTAPSPVASAHPSRSGTGKGPRPSPAPTATHRPHVLVLMEENKNAGFLSGAQYLNSLAATHASTSRWFGIDHPSAPNYVGLVSGSTQTVVGDCTPPSCGPYASPSLGGQLTQAGIPWRAYMESMPTPCSTRSSAGPYAEKHDPFVYFDDVLHNGCASHVLPYPGASALVSTLDGPNAPDFVWITPNLLDDMHDGSVAQGDAWARANLGPVLTSSWFTKYDSTVIVTMDEGDSNGGASCCGQPAGGSIPLIVISSTTVGVGSVGVTGDQYGTLRSIEEEYGLRLLGAAANPVEGDLRSLFG